MKPRYPLTQPFDELPQQLPLLVLDNALLPGGELPLEFSASDDFALFIHALRTDQLLGIVQADADNPTSGFHGIGCAGRIRQYRERKDGRLNLMLTGVCRFRVLEENSHAQGFVLAKVDWSGFQQDYGTEIVTPELVELFKGTLRRYFDRHRMNVDWDLLDKQPIEHMVNNLVLILGIDRGAKQSLLESPTVSERMALFAELLEGKAEPIRPAEPAGNLAN